MLRSAVLICFGYINVVGSQNPELHSNSTFNLVDANSALKLTCTHSTANVGFWWYQPVGVNKFENVLTASYTGGTGSFFPTPLPDVFAGCDCAGHTFTCTLKSLSPNKVGDKWKCSISQNSIYVYSQELTIAWTVPVISVTLTPDLPVIYVLPNVQISFIKCESSEGRPTPIITWYMDRDTPSDYNDDINITGRSISNVAGDRTTSTLSITPSQEQHGSLIYCKVSNGYGSILSVRKPRIDVLVAPSTPKVLYKNVIVDAISVIQNSSVSLECTSSGNPTPNISWKLTNGSVINNAAIELNFMQSLNAVTLTCTVTSDMQPTSGSTTKYNNATTLLVNILYPPTTPTCVIGNHLITSNYIRAIKNTSITINCTSHSNPPPVNYTWTLPGGLKQTGQLFTIPNVLSSGTYILNVINVMNAPSTPQVVIGNANVIFTLDILFAVVVRPIANKTVLQNGTLSVTCPYTEGNPPKTNFTWIQVKTSHIVGVEQNLTFQKMQITDEGFYKCRVNNTMEPSGCCAQTPYDETMFNVDVQYPASIQRFYVDGFENARSITINQSQTVILFCESYSDPVANMSLINNTRNGRDLLTETHNNTISASLENARCEFDKGIYQCQGNNIHNAVQHVWEIEIIIRCAPRSSPFMPPIPKAWTKTNSSVILTYTIVAYPPPRASSAYVWLKQVNNEWSIVKDNTRINIHISQDRLQTNLSILRAQVDDFANYKVTVFNDIGSAEQTFAIQAKEEPAMPQQFRVPEDSITYSSVVVEWKPGFNGGEDQTFVIGFKQEAGKNWTYRTEYENQTTIEGLVAGTSYQFKMYAENSVGRSEETLVITLTTRAKSDGGNNAQIAAIGGGVGGGVLVIIIVVGVVIWKLRSKGTSKRPVHMKLKSKRKEKTVYENSQLRSQRLENVSKEATASSSHNPTKQQCKDTSSSQMTDGLQRTPSFVIVPEPLYGNAGDFKLSVLSIQIQELRKFTSQSKQDPTDIFRDFYSLDTGLKYDTSAASSKVNVPKNRYRNMYPYNKNRVVLPPIDGEVDSDFINASFIDGFDKPKKYIAAQGPLERTIPDIWRMIVAENIQTVAMVTNTVEDGKRKCFQYWPDGALNPCQYRDFKISLIQQEDYADFVIRKLQCSKDGSKMRHTVFQCHYTAWPDKDVPDTALSLLQFWRKVRSYANTGSSPLLVHCSAGVGRTGTFIALDYLYDQGIAIQEIKVCDAVKALRNQRINMVQTKDQYLYLHEVLCEALDPVGNVVQNKEYSTTSSLMQSGIGREFKRLREAEELKAKQSANETLAVEDRFRPMLCQSATGVNKYVNAVYINTFRERNKLILTPGTTEGSTDVDFLWLLHDYKLTTVVILDEKMDPYIPDQGKNTVTGPFSGKLVSKTAQSHYTELVVRFQYYAEHDGFDVRILHFSLWPKKTKVCKISDIMQLLIAAQDIATDLPMVVQCRDGYTRSGLFAVLWCIVERIKRDGEVAVAESVRMAKHRCQHIIPNEEQYRFCHEFAKQYADGCKTYENTEDGIRRKKK